VFAQNVSVKKQFGQLKRWLLRQSKLAILNKHSNQICLSIRCRDNCRMITPICWYVSKG
jgi:hypothetical protein